MARRISPYVVHAWGARSRYAVIIPSCFHPQAAFERTWRDPTEAPPTPTVFPDARDPFRGRRTPHLPVLGYLIPCLHAKGYVCPRRNTCTAGCGLAANHHIPGDSYVRVTHSLMIQEQKVTAMRQGALRLAAGVSTE